MCAVVHHFGAKRDAASSLNNAGMLQSAGLADRASVGIVFPVTFPSEPNLQLQSPIGSLGPETRGSNNSHEGGLGNLHQSGGACGGGRLGTLEQNKGHDVNEDKKDIDDLLVVKKSKGFGSVDSIRLLTEDEDNCPICLEEYDVENPKIDLQCEHHFHLGCILEWMERSDTCPVCDKEMVLNETP